MVSGVRKARSSISAAEPLRTTPRPNRRQLLKLRILVEKGARDLAAQRADQRLQVDALHQSLRVAAPGRRGELSRAGERKAPVGREQDDKRDHAANEEPHTVAPYQVRSTPSASLT